MKPSQQPDWKKIPGWCTDIEADYLYDLARSLIGDMLEIGTYQGRSTVAIGLGCLESGACLYTIDNYKGNPEHTIPPNKAAVLENLSKFGLVEYVMVVDGDSQIMVPRMPDGLDMVFIDGLHTYKAVIEDFLVCWRKLRQGGHLLFHDSNAERTGWHEVVNAVNEIHQRWPIEDLGAADSIRHFRKIP